MKCVVNWIPLRIRVRSRNTQLHLKRNILDILNVSLKRNILDILDVSLFVPSLNVEKE